MWVSWEMSFKGSGIQKAMVLNEVFFFFWGGGVDPYPFTELVTKNGLTWSGSCTAWKGR